MWFSKQTCPQMYNNCIEPYLICVPREIGRVGMLNANITYDQASLNLPCLLYHIQENTSYCIWAYGDECECLSYVSVRDSFCLVFEIYIYTLNNLLS